MTDQEQTRTPSEAVAEVERLRALLAETRPALVRQGFDTPAMRSWPDNLIDRVDAALNGDQTNERA